MEDGVMALNDFLSILDFYRYDISEKSYLKLRLKAHYYIGLIFYKEGDFETS
jgi:hypothetical protein